MDDDFHIRLMIAGRYYPLNIDRNEEEKFRKAARFVNEKVGQYQQRYGDRDGQDLLAMAAFQFALKLIDLEEKADDSPLTSAIQELTEELEEFMQKI